MPGTCWIAACGGVASTHPARNNDRAKLHSHHFFAMKENNLLWFRIFLNILLTIHNFKVLSALIVRLNAIAVRL
ncbi:hypothetical protein HMSLTHF_25130 [Vreelandella aquamarina]|uniref:Uncharacterized protein n=1 Tax=Vreelandella aquamarina TaxID=77097 RepID=A0A6F8SX08_9GAMM|nr:hypothetical protein HMSLTHF_25130 [Halomonas meridiana]